MLELGVIASQNGLSATTHGGNVRLPESLRYFPLQASAFN
jgi:hypothetical protein